MLKSPFLNDSHPCIRKGGPVDYIGGPVDQDYSRSSPKPPTYVVQIKKPQKPANRENGKDHQQMPTIYQSCKNMFQWCKQIIQKCWTYKTMHENSFDIHESFINNL